MEKYLNEKGKTLLDFKWNLNKGVYKDKTALKVFIQNYPIKIQEMILDDKVSPYDFQENLKGLSEYTLNEKEASEYRKKLILDEYDKLLSITKDKYTLLIEGNSLILEKVFRPSYIYYKNYMGIDLGELYNEKNNFRESKYDIEFKFYQRFFEKRARAVAKKIQEQLFDKKLLNKSKKAKNYIFNYNISILNGKEKKIIFRYSVNISEKTNVKSNVIKLGKALDVINENIETYFNPSLYK